MAYPRGISIIELRQREGRGKLLSGLIILNGIPLLIGLPVGLVYDVFHPELFNLYTVLLGVTEGLLLIGIWRWSKLVAYGYILLLAARMVPDFTLLFTRLNGKYVFLLIDPRDVLGTIIWGSRAVLLFLLLLWIYALARKRRLFSW